MQFELVQIRTLAVLPYNWKTPKPTSTVYGLPSCYSFVHMLSMASALEKTKRSDVEFCADHFNRNKYTFDWQRHFHSSLQVPGIHLSEIHNLVIYTIFQWFRILVWSFVDKKNIKLDNFVFLSFLENWRISFESLSSSERLIVFGWMKYSCNVFTYLGCSGIECRYWRIDTADAGFLRTWTSLSRNNVTIFKHQSH